MPVRLQLASIHQWATACLRQMQDALLPGKLTSERAPFLSYLGGIRLLLEPRGPAGRPPVRLGPLPTRKVITSGHSQAPPGSIEVSSIKKPAERKLGCRPWP